MSNTFNNYLKYRKYKGLSEDFDSELKENEYLFEEVFNYIGVFLNQNILIETYLDEILMHHLSKNSRGINGAGFRSLILNSRAFGINDKYTVFRELTKSTFLFYKLVNEKETKTMSRLFRKIIEHRNIIAHNRFAIDIKMKIAVFTIYEKGIQKDIKIDKALMIEYLENANKVIDYLKEFSKTLEVHENR